MLPWRLLQRPSQLRNRKRPSAAWFPYVTIERLWCQLEELSMSGHMAEHCQKLQRVLRGMLMSHLQQVICFNWSHVTRKWCGSRSTEVEVLLLCSWRWIPVMYSLQQQASLEPCLFVRNHEQPKVNLQFDILIATVTMAAYRSRVVIAFGKSREWHFNEIVWDGQGWIDYSINTSPKKKGLLYQQPNEKRL